ncbi:MAG: DNA methyltransferase [Bryobacteraceae bacterium]
MPTACTSCPIFRLKSVKNLTDPPYITRYKSRDSRTVPNDNNATWLKPAFDEMYRVLASDSFALCFYGWPQADRFIRAYRDARFRVVGHPTFPKRYTSATKFLRYQHECAHLLAKGKPRPLAKPIGDVFAWHNTGNKLDREAVFGAPASGRDVLAAATHCAGTVCGVWLLTGFYGWPQADRFIRGFIATSGSGSSDIRPS